MRFSNRAIKAHGLLVGLEIVAFFLAVMATFLLLFTASGGLVAARYFGAVTALTAFDVELLVASVMGLTAGVFLTTGALAVAGYRLYFGRLFRYARGRLIFAVPAVGVLAPFAYGVVYLGTPALPWWLFAIVAISAHLLALRTIGVFSLRRGQRVLGLAVGAVAATPGVASLIEFVTANFLGGIGDEVGRAFVAATATAQIPQQRTVLVVLPLVVAGTFVVVPWVIDASGIAGRRRTAMPFPPSAMRRVPSPARIRRTIRAKIPPIAPGFSAPAVLDRIRSKSTSDSSTTGRSAAGRPRTFRAPPPPSSRGRASPRPPSPPKPERSSPEPDRPDAEPERSPPAAEKAPAKAAEEGQDEPNPQPASTEEGTAESSPPPAPSEKPYGSDSDTQIYVGDVGQYATERKPVEVCPDCGEDVPSDGVYNFCPLCGGTL